MTIPPIEPFLVRINDAARILCVSRSKLKELIVEGEIEMIEIDASTPRVSVDSLRDFIERQRLA